MTSPDESSGLPQQRPLLAALLDPREPYLIPFALLVIGHAVFAYVLSLASEDAYITWRYARNLATGHGLVFNLGSRVMGFTSPVWTLWNSLGFSLTHDCVTWSRVTTLLGDIATLLIVTRLLSARSRAAAWVFAFLFAAWTYFPAVAASGMETAFQFTLMALSAALVARRSLGSGAALGALALFRPEGLIAAVVLSLGARWRDRLVALAIAAGGYGALAWYFGSPLAQSVSAKAQLYGTPGVWAGRHWWEWAVPFSLGRWPSTSEGQFLFLLSIVGAPAAIAGARELWRHRDEPLARLAAAGLAVWAAYAATGAAFFFWYLAVPLGTYFLLLAVGLPHVVRGRGVYASGALFVLGTWSVVFTFYAGRAHSEQTFVEIARTLSTRAQPGERLLIEPIGVVGWYCPLEIVDESGLISPAVAARRTSRESGWYTDVVRMTKPDWLVVRSAVLSSRESFAGAGVPFRSAEERDHLFAKYRSVARVVASGDDGGFEIFQRLR